MGHLRFTVASVCAFVLRSGHGRRATSVSMMEERTMSTDDEPCLDPEDVSPPWIHMNTVVPHAKEESECKACGEALKEKGFLEEGWACVQKRSFWFPWRKAWSIKRDATDSTLKPLSPKTTFKINGADSDGAGPMLVGGTSLPESLRGVFWLSKQGNMSSLMSFGGPNGDGGWTSVGRLVGLRYRIRVLGDRVWSFAGLESAGKKIVDLGDLIYEFTFNDAKAPTFGQIHATFNNLLGLHVGKRLEWLGDFEMTLLDSHKDYPGSKVWERRSYVFGQESESKRYELIQVVDEDGKRIQPAWKAFVTAQTAESVEDPGVVHLRSSV